MFGIGKSLSLIFMLSVGDGGDSGEPLSLMFMLSFGDKGGGGEPALV